jgi:excisionase family DNA binding protein
MTAETSSLSLGRKQAVIEVVKPPPPHPPFRSASPTTRPPLYGHGELGEPKGREAPLWGRSVDHIITRRVRRRTSRMNRSEEYMEKLLLSPEKAAEALGVGRSRVYDLMRTRQLLSVRIGKSRRVPAAAVHAYVERLTEQDALA